MKRQLDLFARPGLSLKPEPDRAGPRLWVPRLVVWREPGVVVREIALRPGLNIVWSPDPTESGEGEQSALGHGSGKSLFCRLLRYCLGEDRYAPENQRHRIAETFKDGLVGAEVMLDGTHWAIVRAIGYRRREVAVAGGDIDAIAADTDSANTGLEPFLEAIEEKALPPGVTELIPGRRENQAWLTALAWFTRDQECRFDHVLDWRASVSDSGSPVRGLSKLETLAALRALLQAIVPDEHALWAEIADLEKRRKQAEQEVKNRQWAVSRERKRLIEALGLNPDDVPPGRLAVDLLRKAAHDRFAHSAHAAPESETVNLEDLRAKADQARSAAENLARSLAGITGRIEELERAIGYIRAELPGLSMAKATSENLVCPVCEVPVERALADGCKLSHKLPDLETARARLTRRQKELAEEEQRLREYQRQRVAVAAELESVRQRADEQQKQLVILEQAREAQDSAWYEARRLVDDAEHFGVLFDEQTDESAEQLAREIERKREQAGAYRQAQERLFQQISRYFDAIVRELADAHAEGCVSLTGNGLELAIQLGGERSTAAIDSLKVLAFDLAVMAMSIEGTARLPAFLVHDSPREADLGLSAYHRLFRFARHLETVSDTPLFQYIITTTTRPPEDLCKEPWLRLTLRGAPAEERLLRCDL